MDAVRFLDIEIDIEPCTKLYHYGRGEYILRPAEGWDKQAIAETSRQADAAQGESDETTAHKVKKLEASMSPKHFLEKEKSSDKVDVKKGSLLFDSLIQDTATNLPRHVLPVFKPGDVVQGQVHLEVVKSIEAEVVALKLKGCASSSIRIYYDKGFYDDVGEVVYVKEKVIVWAKAGKIDTKDLDTLVSDNLQEGTVLAPGKYCFLFNFKLPSNICQSVPPLVSLGKWTGEWAHVAYYIKATINMGKSMNRGNIITHRGIWIEKPVDIAKNPNNLQPVVEKKEQSTGLLGTGKIVCTATIPSRAFIRGSSGHIPLKLEVDNQSGNEINAIKAWVALKGHYRSKPNSWHGSASISIKGDRVHEGAVAAGMCPEFDLKIPLDFQGDCIDGNLIPAGTLKDCDLIDVSYEVCVQLKRKGLHRNVDLNIPILIGTENSKEG